MESYIFVSPSLREKYSPLLFFFIFIFLSQAVHGAFNFDISAQDSVRVDYSDSTETGAAQKSDKIFLPLKIRKDSVITFSSSFVTNEFHRKISRHVGDYVKYLPGVTVIDLVSTGLPVYARIRGSSIEQSQITIDGFPINHNQFGPFDLSLLPNEAFHEVQILHVNPILLAPGSSSGIINFLSPEFKSKRPQTTIVWRKGNFGDSEVDVAFGQQATSTAYVIGAVSYQSSAGKFPNSKYDAQKIRFQFVSQLKSNWYLKYQIFKNQTDVGFPLPENWELETTTSNFHRKSVHFVHLLDIRGNVKSDSMEDIRIRSYYNSLYQDYTDHSIGLKDDYRNRFIGIHLQKYFPIDYDFLTYGLQTEYRWMRSNQIRKVGFFDANLFLNSSHAIRTNHKLYWQGDLEINSGFGVFLSPSLDYRILITPDLTFGISYTFTRRLPDFYELHWKNDVISGNSELEKEKIQLAAFNIDVNRDQIKYKSSFYMKQIQSPIILIPDKITSNSVFFKNGDSEIFCGYEHISNLFLSSKLSVTSLVDIIFKRKLNTSFFINYPQFIKRFSFGYQDVFFNKNLHAGFTITAKLIGNKWNYTGGNYQYPPYYYNGHVVYNKWLPVLTAVLNLRISNLRFQFAIENIFSQKYQIIYGYSERKTSLWANINWHFYD